MSLPPFSAILSLYLKHLFILDGMEDDKAEDTATVLYHTFNFLCYFTSLFGAFLADSFLGKFRTIFYISIVYVIGQSTLAFGAIPGDPEANGIPGLPQQAISYIGLILIAFGTGGIKPCVVSFGAEQFVLPQQRSEMSTFFGDNNNYYQNNHDNSNYNNNCRIDNNDNNSNSCSNIITNWQKNNMILRNIKARFFPSGIFYASINFGSMISTILTPIFRKQSCMGEAEVLYTQFLEERKKVSLPSL